MSEIFGALSNQESEFFPPEYGDISSQYIEGKDEREPPQETPLNTPVPSPDTTATANPVALPNKTRGERGAFIQGLGQGLKSLFNLSALTGETGESDAGDGYCVRQDGGWVYHQYPDGSVDIVTVPSGAKTTSGKTITPGHHAAGSSWAKAVQDKFGDCNAASVSSSGAPTATGATGATSAYASRRVETGAAIGAGVGAAAQQIIPYLSAIMGTQQITPYDVESDALQPTGGPSPGYDSDEGSKGSSPLPWILGGVGLLGVVGLGIFLATRGGDDKE